MAPSLSRAVRSPYCGGGEACDEGGGPEPPVRPARSEASMRSWRRGWGNGPTTWLVTAAIVVLVGCPSNPPAGDGAPRTTAAQPSPAPIDWDDLPIATLNEGRFAFGLDGDIWVMEADGTGRRRLTRGPGTDFDPTWSPDGAWILFRTDRGHYRPDAQGVGVEGLFLIRPDGTDEHQIYPPSAAAYGALF